MVILPVTGIGMGYFGGKGLPFFGYAIPGKKEPNGDIAKLNYTVHTWVGPVFEYMIPLHMGAAGFHQL